MLILDRRTMESVMINDDIEVTVTSIRGGSVKLGFSAPANIMIDRKEIYLQKKQNPKLKLVKNAN